MTILNENISWIKPSFEDEKAELERASENLGIPGDDILHAWEDAELELFNEKSWSRLQNTQSYRIRSIGHARDIADNYGRNIQSIFDGFNQGGSMHAPIVLFRKNKPPYLVGGNARLMAARALNIMPSVWALYL